VRRLPVVLAAVFALAPAPPRAAAASRQGPQAWCATSRAGARDAVWAHREQEARRGPAVLSARDTTSQVGDIAVLTDEGDLALAHNILDLQGAGLRFTPTGGGYSVSRMDLPLFPDTGNPISFGDDDTKAQTLPFAFSFFGHSYTDVHVNSDGNLTFGQGDQASTDRNLGRLLSGPPRLAPLLADLDPSSGGSVAVRSGADRVSVTWTAVPQFDKSDKNTFQVSLYPDGHVEFVYATEVSSGIEEGVVGLGPGAEQAGFTPVDMSAAAGASGGGALAESFRAQDGLDAVAVARKFYRSFGDNYEQLVVFTSRRLVPRGVFSYEQTVQNNSAGIGDRLYNHSAEYGSAGRLESFVLMDAASKFNDDLEAPFLGADSTLAIVAHEVGHRWLAQATFRDGTTVSRELLGRDEVHWSFFMNSSASHLEGNEIEDLGGGHFRTTAAGIRYGPLDQYLMGLRPAEEVPPFFFVRNPGNTSDLDRGRDPEVNVTFDGTRTDVNLADVIAAIGPRSPAFGSAPRTIRQAFIYVAVGGPASEGDLQKVERIRAAFPGYYARSTDGRGTVEPRLN
jgi:hypothetical protein